MSHGHMIVGDVTQLRSRSMTSSIAELLSGFITLLRETWQKFIDRLPLNANLAKHRRRHRKPERERLKQTIVIRDWNQTRIVVHLRTVQGEGMRLDASSIIQPNWKKFL